MREQSGDREVVGYQYRDEEVEACPGKEMRLKEMSRKVAMKRT